jgi:hypothetical protein
VSAQPRAIEVVTARSTGGRLDPGLRVTLNFHPDRIESGVPILGSLAADGLYRSQFETGTSNGALTAHPGGDRWLWESRIFGGVYDDASPQGRPKYGALNFRAYLAGAAPRFGSAHFRLAAHTLERTTFCYPDSVFDPVHFGVVRRMSLLELARADDQDRLDDYVEAQVHGPVLLARDVEALVLDPCFRGTEVEAQARELICPIEWHDGFRLGIEELVRHPKYRGVEFVALGLQLARDGYLDARIIGAASTTGLYNPQSLKRVWHLVARFGRPRVGTDALRSDES